VGCLGGGGRGEDTANVGIANPSNDLRGVNSRRASRQMGGAKTLNEKKKTVSPLRNEGIQEKHFYDVYKQITVQKRR